MISRVEPFIFTSIARVSSDQQNKRSWVFPAVKIKKHFLAQSALYHGSDSSSEANSEDDEMKIWNWCRRPEIKLEIKEDHISLCDQQVYYVRNFFKDITNHRKKTIRVAIFCSRSLPNILKYKNCRTRDETF